MSDNMDDLRIDDWRLRRVKTGQVRADQLCPHPHNPKYHPWKQRRYTAGSINSLGQLIPITINLTNGYLVDGHDRAWLALQHGDETLVEVDYVELTEDEHLLAMQILDESGRHFEYDREKTSDLLKKLQAPDNTLQAIMQGDERLNDMLSDMAEREGLTFGDVPDAPEDAGAQIDRAAELQEVWGVQSGDLWIIPSITGDGQHRLLCGDSTNADDVSRVMGGEKVNGCFTSPPYAEQRKKQYGGIPADEYVEWWADIQQNVQSHITDDGSFFVNIKPHTEDGERVLYVFDLVLAMKRRWGWNFIDELCWRRASVPGKFPTRFKNYFEPVYHFGTQKIIKFYPDNVKAERIYPNSVNDNRFPSGTKSGLTYSPGGFNTQGAYPSNVLDIWNGEPGGNHSAAFPVALPEFFIKAYSDTGDTWLDPFGGSGTTMVACEQLQRQCRMIEIEPRYCSVILQRMADMGLTPERVE